MELPQTVDTVIIGAGPTGLGAAYFLHRTNHQDWLLVDASGKPGGMATTDMDSHGFHWDLGGHVIHSHFPSFDHAMAQHSEWTHPKRGGWVRVADKWCPTPIQRNLGSLDEGRKIVAELSEIADSGSKQVENLEEYYTSTFGATLNNIFFAPFNFKQWAWPLREISYTWTNLLSGSNAPNVPVPKLLLDTPSKAVPEDTSSFPYPKFGTGSLWQTISEKLPRERQIYRTSVIRIELQEKKLHLNTGDTICFKRCLSSIPITSLLQLIREERPDLALFASRFQYTSTLIIGFGFLRPMPAVLVDKTWIFSADPAVPFHRATIPTNFSSSLSGPDHWSIMFEVSISKMRNLHTGEVITAIQTELRKWGVDQEPISRWQRHLEFGYPIPFVGRDDLLRELLPALEAYSVFPRGRFGGWRYESSNQDYAFAQGYEAAAFIHTGQPETSYWPDRYSKTE